MRPKIAVFRPLWPEKWPDCKKSKRKTCPVIFDVQRYLICCNPKRSWRDHFSRTHRQTDRQTNLILLIYTRLGLTPVAPGWRPPNLLRRLLKGCRPSTSKGVYYRCFQEPNLWSLGGTHTSGLRPSFLANCPFSSGFQRGKMKFVRKTDDSFGQIIFSTFQICNQIFQSNRTF